MRTPGSRRGRALTTIPLPPNADLAKLEDHARSVRDQVRAGVPGALELVRTHHPRRADLRTADPGFRLADAQLTQARLFGFSSWSRLVAHLRLIAELGRSPHELPVGQARSDADELLRLACLTYGSDDPTRVPRAHELLTAHPHLARASVHTAAATGDVTAMLRDDPALARAEGGPFRWVPLLYLTYSRLPCGDAVATARVLLDAGADPDAGYLFDGLVPPFTALTGVFGSGEGDQPPHPRWPELARLLLERGAEANDPQTIYNWGLGSLRGDDPAVLELLCEFGFGHGGGGPWKRRLGEEHPTPAQLVADELAHAACSGLPRRTRLLIARGADPDSIGDHPAFAGRTAYQAAVEHGHTEVVALLAAAGADTSSVDERTVLVGRLLAGDGSVDRAAARALLPTEPGLLHTAAELGRTDAARLLVGLGWDVNAVRRTTPLHEAAMRDDRALVEVLLALGADPTIHDTAHDSPPAGWARYFGHEELADLLDRAVR